MTSEEGGPDVTGRLADKVIVVTGGTRGLGRHMVQTFVDEGAHVTLIGRNADDGNQVVAELAGRLGSAHFARGDISVEADVAGAFAAVAERWGRLDGVVANASGYQDNAPHDGLLSEMSLDGWNQIIASDLTGTFLTVKHALQAMCAGNGGSVVTLASQHAIRGVNGAAGYSAAKGGVIALTHNVASYYARYDIRCNCIAPGVTRTGGEYLEALLDHPVQGPPIWDVHLGRVGQPEDVSYAATYLLADESRQVNGVILPVDGGAVSASHFRRPVAPDLPQYERKRTRAPEF
ncbi:SDR family NAD(P)-dependent oxidoreductase [Nocardioides humi]|uniref:3-oxoacyl-[acyl-carrier-protein] reductase n=1 Tax=Nocardioides humi TaxID=449461 RepID=A0ABN2BFG6_9ACTN|nr:SDR family oxidoreductase [Nocardioides humi]